MGLEDHSGVLFDARSGSHVHTFLHEGRVGSVSLSADGHWALTGSDDETIALWDLGSGERVHRIPQSNPVNVVAISRTGRFLFAAAEQRVVGLWDGGSGSALHTLAERNTGVTAARFSQDESQLLIGYVNRRIELWSTSSGQRIARWDAGARNPWHPTGSAILAVGFTTDHRLVRAITGDGRLLDLALST